jgi:GT2 family glycosyltransferase
VRGFSFTRPLFGISGKHIIKLLIQTKDGNSREIKANVKIGSSLRELQKELKKLDHHPGFTFILIRDDGIEGLRSSLESLLSQVYSRWELYLPAKTQESFIPESNYSMIKSSRNLKEVLSRSEGEYVGFLRSGDELLPETLLEVAKYLTKKNPSLIYTDELLFREDQQIVSLYYKPDFSLDYFLSYPYMGYFILFKKELLKEIEDLPEDLDICAYYKILFKMVKMILKSNSSKEISHIPQILYKRRVGNASQGRAEGTYRQMLEDLIKDLKMDASVEKGPLPPFFRVKRKIKGEPLVSIIIPTGGRRPDLFKKCLHSLREKNNYKRCEVIIIDNSEGRMQTVLKELKDQIEYTLIEYPYRYNFSKMNNLAERSAKGEYLLFLNDDIEPINSSWLEAMLEHSQREEVGIVGAKLLYPDGRIQHAGVIIGLFGLCEHILRFHPSAREGLPEPGYMGWLLSIRNLSAVTAACMMIRRTLFREIGGFDENLPRGFNDIDLCLRVREKGYLVVFTPYALLYHYEMANRGKGDLHPEDNHYFKKKWKTLIQRGDPYYNLSLPLDTFDPTPFVKFQEWDWRE